VCYNLCAWLFRDEWEGIVVPILAQDELDFVSRGMAQTERIGARLAGFCQAGDVICLQGELGVGKTCLARGIARGLGVAEPITSPTFVLVGEYRTARPHVPLYHVDLYRITSPAEALAVGVEDYLYGHGICVIEWAERIREILPAERLWITMRHVDEQRRGLTIAATGARYKVLLQQFKRNVFGIGES